MWPKIPDKAKTPDANLGTQIPQLQSDQTFPKNNKLLSKKALLIILLVVAFAVILVVLIVGKSGKSQVEQTLSTPSVSDSILKIQNTQFDIREAGSALLQDGKIWLVDKNLQKKMLFDLAEISEPIVDLNFSPLGEGFYVLTESGELWKSDLKGKLRPLVTKDKDMLEAIQDASYEGERNFLKGKVVGFYLSPDGNYIAYETLEKYTGCCGSSSDIPVTQLRIMKNDGTDKVVVVKPSNVSRELVSFDGWFPDSRRILFHYTHPDEVTQGSAFFEVGLNGRNYKRYKAIDFEEREGTITVAGSSPFFSPKGQQMVYIEGGVLGGGRIWMANADGSDKKLLLENEKFNLANIIWSEDASLLLVNGYNQFAVLTSGGKVVYQKQLERQEELASVISPDNRYLVGLNKTQDNKTDKLFILDFINGKKKEFVIKNASGQPVNMYVYPQFISENNVLYYLASLQPPTLSGKDATKPTSELWAIDFSNSKIFKIAENVSVVRKIPKYLKKIQ